LKCANPLNVGGVLPCATLLAWFKAKSFAAPVATPTALDAAFAAAVIARVKTGILLISTIKNEWYN
jgi:hypothetical protein